MSLLQAEADQLNKLRKSVENGVEQAENSRRASAKHEDVAYLQSATFKVDNELFGIDVMQVKEVLRYSQITPVPGSDTAITGIINVRGNVVTVIDTRRLFHLPQVQDDDDTRIIVVELNEQEVIGLVVDSVDEVINLPQNDVDRAPNVAGEEGSRRYVQGVAYYQNQLIILLDLSKVLQSVIPAESIDSY